MLVTIKESVEDVKYNTALQKWRIFLVLCIVGINDGTLQTQRREPLAELFCTGVRIKNKEVQNNKENVIMERDN